MPRARLKKTRRISAVQTQLLRTAQWRASAIQRECERLDVSRRELVSSMGDELFGPLLVEQAARRLSHLVVQSAQAAAAHAVQEEAVRTEGLSLKRTERAVRAAERASRSAEDRATVAEIAEQSALRKTAGASLA